jgi:hypothetical protein
MKKNILNEQISRIKSMMGKINESEYEMESLSNMSMSEDDDNMEDDNTDSNNLEITHAGCFPQHWIVDVNMSNDNGEEDSATVHVETMNDEVVSVTCDDDDNLHSRITNDQAIEFVKQKIEDGTLQFPPFIAMDGDGFHL